MAILCPFSPPQQKAITGIHQTVIQKWSASGDIFHSTFLSLSQQLVAAVKLRLESEYYNIFLMFVFVNKIWISKIWKIIVLCFFIYSL